MQSNFIGAALAFCAGAGLAGLGYLVLRRCLRLSPSRYAAAQLGKTAVTAAFLAALLFLGKYTPWSGVWLAVGGALGATLAGAPLTLALVKYNNSRPEKEGEDDG